MMGSGPVESPIPAARQDVIVQIFDDEYVLYDESAGRVHVLNGSSHFIWSCCTGTKTASDIVAEMLKVYEGVSRERAQQDVLLTLERFRTERLLVDDGAFK